MTRLYEPLAYTDRPIQDRYWSRFLPQDPDQPPPLTGHQQAEVAIIGAGYTGLSAAIQLADAGVDVAVLDANGPGWGASGRNGGLVSVGSAKLEDARIRQTYGAADAQVFFDAERAAVSLVETYIDRFDLDVDRHSRGYTYLAHSPAAVGDLHAYGREYSDRYGLDYEYIPKAEMPAHGLNSPDLHGAVTLPIGFALNPMKFVLGLTGAARRAGARLVHNSPVSRVEQHDGQHLLVTPNGSLRAKTLLICTNGYSADTVPSALAARYLPVQSNILVTRTLREAELAAQGWTSDQMCVDSRRLLHYFRLLPDRRMLFGLRGSVRVNERSMRATEARARADFDRMFPAWRDVETEYFWSGLICLTRSLVPFVGPIPGLAQAYAGLGFHGSGVTMAPYAGALLADLVLGRQARPHPDLMKRAPKRFELGRWRRGALPLAFAYYGLRDRM
ncbi:FAD-dependent oxidoreductase [Phaeobacter sp.]|uniref:NAD(P)/FAD-dependent oxidoreductase n=1 Tax=Phaeobacter sp. TaxID=1902409 RepID=UPI0025F60D3E|nr:FAD-dependent oxidoreductase [Phaeobacter sp.]